MRPVVVKPMTVHILQTDPHSIALEQSYPTDTNTLYATLLHPASLVNWCTGPGQTCRIERWEPAEGGTFTLVLEEADSGKETRVHGDLTVLDPPRRIEVVLRPDGSDEELQRVVVTLAERGDLALLRLHHEGLDDADAVERAAAAWQLRLDRVTGELPPTRSLVRVRSRHET